MRYWRDIESAAANHHINKNVLAAVIIWESAHAREGTDRMGAEAAKTKDHLIDGYKGWGASVGITQLEIYKARMMLIKYYYKERDWGKATLGQVTDQLLHAPRAIQLAAAWMEYLKQNVWYENKDGSRHNLTDREAAEAYCGCSGVTVDNPLGGYPLLSFKKYKDWKETGYLDRKDSTSVVNRQRDLEHLWSNGSVEEFWRCGRAACWTSR
ncbi:hypothetical protein [Nonomuraea sp. NPDC048901]|uniref:hypothetical protein n=1 Tax=Nonomuraea sp. NPDC048901 TaxID=3155627 RepID=UPI0033E30522